MIYIGADHAGFELKETVKGYLMQKGIEFEDFGATQFNPKDDYPDFGFPVAEAVSKGAHEGILFCESAGGMTILANKVKGIRAVECGNVHEVEHARVHNDANILVLSKMSLDPDNINDVLDAWFNTKFTNEERHVRRLNKIAQYEQEHWK